MPIYKTYSVYNKCYFGQRRYCRRRPLWLFQTLSLLWRFNHIGDMVTSQGAECDLTYLYTPPKESGLYSQNKLRKFVCYAFRFPYKGWPNRQRIKPPDYKTCRALCLQEMPLSLMPLWANLSESVCHRVRWIHQTRFAHSSGLAIFPDFTEW